MEEWFSVNIARCEAERDKAHGKERDAWSGIIRMYEHLAKCPLRHSNHLPHEITLCEEDID